MEASPLVSVILPVYNSEKHIYEALESIVNQSYQNLEIITIINGTTDKSLDEVNKFNDKRIKVIDIKEAIGLIKALNIGIEESNGKYIARMDADDIAIKTRIEKQVKFLEEHSDYGLCGSWYKTFDGTSILGKNKIEDQEIKQNLLHQCHICHPSVLLRKSIVDEYNLKYSTKFPHSEDYALWVEMTDKTKFYTYPEVLLKYRDHETNISKLEGETQQNLSVDIKRHYFKKVGINISNEEVILYTRFAYADFTLTTTETNMLDDIIRRLLNQLNIEILNKEQLADFLKVKWNALIINSPCSKKELMRIHKTSEIARNVNSILDNAKIYLRLLIRS